jgi:putative membrane-bound dehydrogenase-like protein
MNRLALAGLLLASAALELPGDGAKTAKTHRVRLNGHTFTLPVGFTIELAAGPPLVDRPITADFDEDGRLYVADSSGSSENVQLQLKKKPHRILRLEDTDGDGRFDRRTVFADKMMFPEGTMWYAGSLYVSAAPSIWKLTDTDGDGVADQRVEWFQGKTLTGCANDLHGPYLGPDGWIYWCKGAFAQQTYPRPGRPPLVTRAAHIFRARPDGSGVEPVMTGGMDNPVDVTFTPGGERIFTCTFLQFPGGGRRDGLIHAVYGGVYGKDWDVLQGHPWTGPAVMPVLDHLGPAAPCGLTRYQSKVFGPDYQDNLFACLFNMQKVTRHVLVPQGATFTTRDEDFLVSDKKDFHPTDVLEDADGSLLVIDTGGWYKLCCPTSQLYKPDVLGAIYRIRRLGTPRVEDPRGRKLAWAKMASADLARLLADERPAVCKRAVETLAARGAAGLVALKDVRDALMPRARVAAVWTATRIDQPEARTFVRQSLADADETVRQAALHSISVWKDRQAVPVLLKLLKSPSVANRRAAAEALGRLGDRSAVPALLETLGGSADRVLEHSLTFALIEIADAQRTANGLKSDKASIRRGALVALDQMDGGQLEASVVTRDLNAADPRLKEAAWWIAGHHPAWGGALAGFLDARLKGKGLTAAEESDLVGQLAKLAHAPAVQALLAERAGNAGAAPAARRLALEAMAQAGLREAPAAWVASLTAVLAGGHPELQRQAVRTARALRLPRKGAEKLATELLRVGKRKETLADVRLGAFAAVPGGLPGLSPGLFAFLQEQLGRQQPAVNRALAADVLARARLQPEQLAALADGLKAAGPMEINRLLDAFAQTKDDALGLRLVAALARAPAKSGLRPGSLRECLSRFGPRVQKSAAGLYAELNLGTAEQKAKVDRLLTTLKSGDVRRGQAVFNSTKASCVACHAIGYIGGKVGPDLTRIGSIRTERDLLEAIVFPSSSFVRGFEPVVVTTRDGKAYNGVIRKDAADELVLATGPGQEARIARSDVEEVQPSRVSVMPAGLEQLLTPRELADLVAFLKACR